MLQKVQKQLTLQGLQQTDNVLVIEYEWISSALGQF